MNEKYNKRFVKHLENIDRIYNKEANRLRFKITVKYIGEVVGCENDHKMALDLLRWSWGG